MKGKFETLIHENQPVLVDFYADWCAPCKAMSPVLKEVKEYFGDRIRIIKINVDLNPVVSGKNGIQSIPSLILFRGGSPVWRGVGTKTAGEIIRLVTPYIS